MPLIAAKSCIIQGGPKITERHTSVITVNNDWYQWKVCFLLRKIIPRSAILVKRFLFKSTLYSPFKKCPSSAKTSLENLTKTLAIIIVRVNGHSLHQQRIRTVLCKHCKECPLRELAYRIIAFNYGERFCHVFK